MSKSSIDNCREWGQSKAAVNSSGLIQPRREDGVSRESHAGAVQMFGTDRRQKHGLSGTVHPPPQRITSDMGKPRSCQA